jgi:hypothetical protein
MSLLCLFEWRETKVKSCVITMLSGGKVMVLESDAISRGVCQPPVSGFIASLLHAGCPISRPNTTCLSSLDDKIQSTMEATAKTQDRLLEDHTRYHIDMVGSTRSLVRLRMT